MVSLIRSGGHFSESSMEDVVVKKGVRVAGLHVPDVGSNLAVAISEGGFPWNDQEPRNG